jgi:hypothetical protein
VPRLFLLLALIAVFYILLRRIAAMPPHRRRSEYLKLGLGTALVVTVLLALAGKMHWLGAAITGLLVAARQALPVLLRLFPLLGHLGGLRGAQAGPRRSTVSTRILRMHLDLETGDMSGEVLEGQFQDWQLGEMNRSQLETLRDYCRAEDAESLKLLEGYLEQRFGQDFDSGEEAPRPTPEGMTRQEALDILGLDGEAGEDEIVAAHRSLMQKLHPDRGGSDYLAAKINQAKDFLLGA